MRWILFLALMPVAAFAQTTVIGGGGSGPCVLSGSQTSGYVLTATDGGTGCDWESVGGASVDATTAKNAQYCPDTSVSANTITCSTTTTFPTLAAGQLIRVKVANTNTGATTIAVSGGSSKAVTKFGNTALAAGNLVASTVYLFAYDGTEWQVVNPKLLAADIPTLASTALSDSSALVRTSDTASVTNTMLAGSIANGKLANSSVTVAGKSVALGASATVASTDLSDTAVVVRTSDTGSVTSTMLAGSIGNAKLSNSATTVNGSTCTLGSSCTPNAPNLSGTPALPNGTTATTQSAGAGDTKLATDAYADSDRITAAVTYYIVPTGETTCVYNGDGGTGCTPSDSNDGLTKATPFATLQKAADTIRGKRLSAVVTVQRATPSGGRCFADNGVIFENPAAQGNPVPFFVAEETGATPVYPEAYIYLVGDTTTPNNVPVVGATTCSGTTSSTANAVTFLNTPFRVRGQQFKYYGGSTNGADFGPIQAVNAHGFVEDVNAISDNKGTLVVPFEQSFAHLGGSFTITNTGWVDPVGLSGIDFVTPLYGTSQKTALTASISGALPGAVIIANSYSKIFVDNFAWSFAGSGTYTMIAAYEGGNFYYNDSAGSGQTVSVNAANATILDATQYGYIAMPLTTSGNVVWTKTACKVRASAREGGFLAMGTPGFTCTNADVVVGGGRLSSGGFPATTLDMSGPNVKVTTLNGLTITTSTGTLTIPNGVALTGPASSGTAATLGNNETFSGNKTFTGVVDAGGASRTAPAKVGTSLPGTCTVGDIYFKSDATAGQNIYECQSTNTWTQQINSGAPVAGTGVGVSGQTVSLLTRNCSVGGVTVTNCSFPTGVGSHIASGDTDFYTVPANRTAMVTVVAWYNDSASGVVCAPKIDLSGTFYAIGTAVTVAANSSSAPNMGPLFLTAGQKLAHNCATGSVINVNFGIVEFDSDTRVGSALLTTFINGDNTVFTASGNGAYIMPTNALGLNSVSSSFIYDNFSGGSLNYKWNVRPGCAAASTSNLLFPSTANANNTVALKLGAVSLASTDCISINTGSNSASQIAWVNWVAMP